MSRRNFEAVVMDTVYAVIHVEYVFTAHILIYILHKYWMRKLEVQLYITFLWCM